LADQIRRAALSVVLNISEGASEIRPAEKARLFNLARRSAGEIAAALEVAVRLKIFEVELISDADQQCDQVMAMLTRLMVHHRTKARELARQRKRKSK
jgi:four helix bundle protein